MGRSIIAARTIEKYLKNLSERSKISYGLIIGQPSLDGKDYVVHLARTMKVDKTLEENDSTSTSFELETVEHIDVQDFAYHVSSLVKMLPGSFYITGVFIVSDTNVFEGSAFSKIKPLFQELLKFSQANQNFCSSSDFLDEGEKLILHYSTSSNNVSCKTFKPAESSDLLKPAEWKFIEKPPTWFQIETNYEFDDVFASLDAEIENNLNNSLKSYVKDISKAILFIHNERIDDTQTLEGFLKEKHNKKDDSKSLKASIYLPMNIKNQSDTLKVEKITGTVRYLGIVYSKVFVNSKTTFKNIQTFIRNDIIRSLASRLQLYNDGLAENSKDSAEILISEPPRRIFIPIPDSGGLQFSEYFFPTEDEAFACDSARDFLDLEINPEEILTDLEIVPNNNEELSPARGEEKDGNKISTIDKKTFCIIGVAAAALAVVLAILLQVILR